jgi:hypothetical protein
MGEVEAGLERAEGDRTGRRIRGVAAALGGEFGHARKREGLGQIDD